MMTEYEILFGVLCVGTMIILTVSGLLFRKEMKDLP
jgi:hypothetical protein